MNPNDMIKQLISRSAALTRSVEAQADVSNVGVSIPGHMINHRQFDMGQSIYTHPAARLAARFGKDLGAVLQGDYAVFEVGNTFVLAFVWKDEFVHIREEKPALFPSDSFITAIRLVIS